MASFAGGERLASSIKINEPAKSANFRFLAKPYPDLERIGAGSERYFSDDPIVALVLLRQFGELLAQMLAARSGLLTDARELQADLLRRLRVEGSYPSAVMDLFHQLRQGDHAIALSCLKKWARQPIFDHENDLEAVPVGNLIRLVREAESRNASVS
jgi:hypothetical protein